MYLAHKWLLICRLAVQVTIQVSGLLCISSHQMLVLHKVRLYVSGWHSHPSRRSGRGEKWRGLMRLEASEFGSRGGNICIRDQWGRNEVCRYKVTQACHLNWVVKDANKTSAQCFSSVVVGGWRVGGRWLGVSNSFKKKKKVDENIWWAKRSKYCRACSPALTHLFLLWLFTSWLQWHTSRNPAANMWKSLKARCCAGAPLCSAVNRPSAPFRQNGFGMLETKKKQEGGSPQDNAVIGHLFTDIESVSLPQKYN